MENIKYLLKEVNLILEKYQQRLANEDTFNLFSVLMKESDEVNLHSKFIETLLNPDGPHKMGTKFLSLFLEVVDCKFNYSNNTVETEREQDNIDILLIDYTMRSAVIIENKIYSGDSNHEDEGQLERYYRVVIEDYGIPQENVEVLYLTLDGHEPSEESVATSCKYVKLQQKVKCISYSVEIIKWLVLCAKEAYNKPVLRESIVQYITLLKKMTNNDASMEEIKELLSLIGKNDDNLYSAKLLIDNFKHLQWYALRDTWDELDCAIKNRGYQVVSTIANEDLDMLIHGGPKQKKINLRYEFIADNIPIVIYADYEEWLYWGVPKNVKIGAQEKKRITEYVKRQADYEANEQYLYWSWFGLEDDNWEDVCCSDFSCEGTFKLISPQHRKETIDSMLNDIEKFIDDLKEMKDSVD